MSESGLLSTLFSSYLIIRRSMIIADESYCVVELTAQQHLLERPPEFE